MTAKTSTPAIYRVDVTYSLRSLTCYSCGLLFGVEAGYDDRRRDDKQYFYCPNGHGQAYIKSTTQEALEQAKAELEAARALAGRESRRRYQAEIDSQADRRRAAAYKGWATRIRNRIANGVCPCCNRSFTNVRRHMTTQHPAFQIPEEVK